LSRLVRFDNQDRRSKEAAPCFFKQITANSGGDFLVMICPETDQRMSGYQSPWGPLHWNTMAGLHAYSECFSSHINTPPMTVATGTITIHGFTPNAVASVSLP
jgi:hypothetical protein